GIPLFYKFLNAQSVTSPSTCGGPATITYSITGNVANNCDFFGYIRELVVTWQAIDLCGNKTSLTITVHLIDNEAPMITGVPDIACIDDPLLDNVDAIDNCGNAHLRYWDVEIPNPCGIGTAISRTYEAYDDCGNMTRDTAILLPNDHTKPTLEFVTPLLLNLELGEVLIMNCSAHGLQITPFGIGDVSFEDSCRFGVTITYSEKLLETGNCSVDGNVGLTQLLWTATDACGNLSTLSVIASIEDKISPVFVNFKPVITIGCKDTIPGYVATDNCGKVTITTEDRYFYSNCPYEYYIERYVTATDPCGNSITEFQTIHVGNGNGPVFTGVVPELCDDLTIPRVTAFDQCAGVFVAVTMTQDTLATTCRDGYVIHRVWTAVDACGHVNQVEQNIVINDKTPPEILIPSYSIIRKFIDQDNVLIFLSSTEVMDLLNALDESSVYAQDECDLEIVPVFTVDTTYAENCVVDGYYEIRTYTWVATDVCGNSSSISFSVHIMDNIAPVFQGLANDTTITCAPLIPVPEVVVIDPSQPTTLVYTQSIVNGINPNEFIVHRLWISTDGCGNSAQATQQITWIPNSLVGCNIILPPAIECNSNSNPFSANVSGGLGQITYVWEVTGSDWFIQGGQGTDLIKMYAGYGPALLTLTVTDALGCSSFCSVALDCTYPLTFGLNAVPSSSQPEEDNTVIPTLTDALTSLPTDYLQSVNLWPNPAAGTINLSFESIVDNEVTYSFINLLGQVIYSHQMNAARGFNAQRIDITLIPEGTYLVRVKTEKELHTKIVVIMRNE
ncbi:MAG: T9SS type A sorting domain-containing protein, partial [Saprospiraceae bacterium]